MKQETQSPRKQRLWQDAIALFAEFKNAYAAEWRRQDACERMYRGEHWHDVPLSDENEPRPVMPVLQAGIETLAADLIDRTPSAVITPERGADDRVARIVDALIARNHDSAGYPLQYRLLTHDLLVRGWCVHEVGYDPELNMRLGGAYIRRCDPRGILFDPLCTDVQDSRAVFKLSQKSRDWLCLHFPADAPFIRDMPAQGGDAPTDTVLFPDRANSVLLIEYWRREYDAQTKSYTVHMAQMCGGRVLCDSRDQKPQGYYAHGQYPFVISTLYPRSGSCLGFGVCDLFASSQKYADKLDQIVLKNALMASRNKLLVTEASGFDSDDLKDWTKEVHRGESLSGISWFATPPLPAYLLAYIRETRDNIKNESGANEAARGNYSASVTAASAITALQEASTKRTRMASLQLYEGFAQAVRMEIEVEREFNFFARPISIITDGVKEEVFFDSSLLTRPGYGGVTLPIEFYISVKAQQQNRFAAAAQNELVMQLFKLGALNAADAVELMHFDGKEQVLAKLRQSPPGASTIKK